MASYAPSNLSTMIFKIGLRRYCAGRARVQCTNDGDKLQVAAGASRAHGALIARDHPACLSSPYRGLSTLCPTRTKAQKGLACGWGERRAGSFMPAPQKKNYLGRSVILRGVCTCAPSLKVVTNLDRDTAGSRAETKPERESERERGAECEKERRGRLKRETRRRSERRREVDLLSRRHRGG